MDIHKLKETDHDRYLKEYYDWCRWVPDYDWYDSLPSIDPVGVFSDMPARDWEDLLETMMYEFNPYTELGDYLTGLCDDLASRLRQAYEDETSEERFIEHCEANEVTFEETEDEVQD